MRIHLITAEPPESRRLRGARLIQFPQLTMPPIAVLTRASTRFTTPTRSSSASLDRPADEIVREVGGSPTRAVVFWDDNIGANPRHSKELFRALAPLGKWWTSQCTATAAKDEEFQRLAAASGCKALFMGKYDGKKHCVFRPARMSPEELVAGTEWASRRVLLARLDRAPDVGLARGSVVEPAPVPALLGVTPECQAVAEVPVRTAPRCWSSGMTFSTKDLTCPGQMPTGWRSGRLPPR